MHHIRQGICCSTRVISDEHTRNTFTFVLLIQSAVKQLVYCLMIAICMYHAAWQCMHAWHIHDGDDDDYYWESFEWVIEF